MTKPDPQIWLDVLAYIKQHHAEACRQWFDELDAVGTVGGVFKVRAHKSVQRAYLERQCAEIFNEAIRVVTGRLLTVRFIGSDEHAPANSGDVRSIERQGLPDHNGLMPRIPAPGAVRAEALYLIPDNTFDHFVVGPENRLAHASAIAVASNPGKTYNPLFIHGGVGLGKTHLLQAICLQVMNDLPGVLIHYVSCDTFMNQFMDAVQAGQMADFRHRFRDVDMLVIDDIHFLAKRDRTQEEFFHTFNSLYQAGKQIVLSSDAPPHEIPDLEERLVSRFQSGMVAPMNPPLLDTRVQIVKQRARLRGWQFPEDVAYHIAATCSTNIRELEGAIIRVHALSTTDRRPITLDVAREVLAQTDSTPRPETTITAIIDAVIEFYGVKLTDLQSKRRQKSIAHPRQICMYLARRHTRFSLEEIGGYFGGRDHTTVMHAIKRIEEQRTGDAEFGRILTALEGKIRPGFMPPASAAATVTA